MEYLKFFFGYATVMICARGCCNTFCNQITYVMWARSYFFFLFFFCKNPNRVSYYHYDIIYHALNCDNITTINTYQLLRKHVKNGILSAFQQSILYNYPEIQYFRRERLSLKHLRIYLGTFLVIRLHIVFLII